MFLVYSFLTNLIIQNVHIFYQAKKAGYLVYCLLLTSGFNAVFWQAITS